MSAAKITPKTVDVLYAIAEVGPVLPHAVERKISDRPGLAPEDVGARR